VVAALGQPTSTTMTLAGLKYAVYSYAAVSSRPQNFIPYIGPLVSGYDTKSSAVTFSFDGRDVYEHDLTQSNLGMGANLAAGGQPAAPTQQPR
jgi:hypothetical protein